MLANSQVRAARVETCNCPRSTNGCRQSAEEQPIVYHVQGRAVPRWLAPQQATCLWQRKPERSDGQFRAAQLAAAPDAAPYAGTAASPPRAARRGASRLLHVKAPRRVSGKAVRCACAAAVNLGLLEAGDERTL